MSLAVNGESDKAIDSPDALTSGQNATNRLLCYRARMEPLLIASAARDASLKANWVKSFSAPPPLCQARVMIGFDPIRAEQGSSSTCPQRSHRPMWNMALVSRIRIPSAWQSVQRVAKAVCPQYGQ